VGQAQWPTRKDPTKDLNRASACFAVDLTGEYTTHRFIWNSTSVSFQSLKGHYDDNTGQFEQWIYQPTDPSSHISQKPMPIQLNLWLYNGDPPVNGLSVEVIVRSFTLTPSSD